jgi:hypothetical protein
MLLQTRQGASGCGLERRRFSAESGECGKSSFRALRNLARKRLKFPLSQALGVRERCRADELPASTNDAISPGGG